MINKDYTIEFQAGRGALTVRRYREEQRGGAGAGGGGEGGGDKPREKFVLVLLIYQNLRFPSDSGSLFQSVRFVFREPSLLFYFSLNHKNKKKNFKMVTSIYAVRQCSE